MTKSVKFGDVIGVHRLCIEHYGVYENDNCIYEYNGKYIGTTTLHEFVGDAGGFFVLNFEKTHSIPHRFNLPYSGIIGNTSLLPNFDIFDLLEYFKKMNYRLYSPDETIQRAKSRLGEEKYNLVFNNCEHYAIWCKTGIHESYQVENFLKAFSKMGMITENTVCT